LSQCKATINIIAWAHCMFFADQVVQLLDVFPTRYRLQSIQIVRKALFFNLISAPICTRSFPRGFSLATPNYVLCRRLPSLLQNFVCSLYRIFCTSLSIRLCWLSKASSWVLLAN